MKGILLKLHLLFIFLFLALFGIQAQDLRFIYIQTENQTPFYVKLDDQILSSSSSGYIILPKLTRDSYQILIGFPQKSISDFTVTLNLNGADAGYLLKTDIDESWYVVNMQNSLPVRIDKRMPAEEPGEFVINNDLFARILSEVVADSTIRMTRVMPYLATIDKTKGNNAIDTAVEGKSVTVFKTDVSTVAPRREISKLEQIDSPEGLQLTYLDISSTTADTVMVFIAVNAALTEDKKAGPNITPDADVKKIDAVIAESVFIDMGLQNPNLFRDSGMLKKDDFVITQRKNILSGGANSSQQGSQVFSSLKKSGMIGTCKETATYTEFLNLRRKMAAEKIESDMLKTAGKRFRNTCFSTEQIKNLGALFIKEEEKYNFFVLAYPCISDSKIFESLEDQLADNYYKERFKAMFIH
jgi:hypothetical protein